MKSDNKLESAEDKDYTTIDILQFQSSEAAILEKLSNHPPTNHHHSHLYLRDDNTNNQQQKNRTFNGKCRVKGSMNNRTVINRSSYSSSVYARSTTNTLILVTLISVCCSLSQIEHRNAHWFHSKGEWAARASNEWRVESDSIQLNSFTHSCSPVHSKQEVDKGLLANGSNTIRSSHFTTHSSLCLVASFVKIYF